jgi:predicted nucleic acid-binding protein
MKIVLDTMCIIYAFNPSLHAHAAMKFILNTVEDRQVELWVSRHTLFELSKDDPVTTVARAFAHHLKILPHWPIGAFSDQVTSWDNSAGTWEDARRYQDMQTELATLANSGNDIHDRGAYLDALVAGADLFVTSDKHLVLSCPASRLERRFGLRVITPEALATEFSKRN